jgi:ATP-dependent DNA ligase
VKAGVVPTAQVESAILAGGTVRSRVDPHLVECMKSESVDDPSAMEGWIFELKFDGYRVLASNGAK